MKIIRITLSLSVVAIIMLFASCKKSVPKQIKYIPKDASVVFAANAKRLNDKLEGSQVKIDSLLKAVFAESKAAPEEITRWEGLKDAGIDWQSDIFGFYQQKKSMMRGINQSFGAVAAVSSASKLEAYLKKQLPQATIKKGADGYSEIALNGDAVAGWNDEVFILTSSIQNHYHQDEDDQASASITNPASAQLAGFFKLKPEESLNALDTFKTFIQGKADLLLWFNSGGAFNVMPDLGMTKLGDLVKNSYSGVQVNFENGKVEGTFTTYSNKIVAEMVKKYPSSAIDLDMVTTYPSNNIAGFFSFNLNFGIISEILRYAGFESIANQYLSEMGFTVDDVTKAFKGDFAMVFSDLALTEKANPFFPDVKRKTPTYKFIVNAKVGDKVAYNKVLSALATKGWLTQTGDVYTPAMSLGGFLNVELNNKNMLVASDSTLLTQYKAGAGKAVIAGDVISKAKGKLAYGYIDFAKVFTLIPVDSSEAAIINQVKSTFKDAYVSADKYDGNVSKGEAVLHTGNDKENSLATFVKLGQAVAAKAKADKARWSSEETMVDSTAVTVDTAAAVAPIK